MLRRMCRVGWHKAKDESSGDWRRRHTRAARQQLLEAGAEDIATAMLRRQFRWILGNLRRFASDTLGQTRRTSRPQERSRHHILASIRDDMLPSTCRERSSTACAVTVFLTMNDEEGWKLQQGIMMQLDHRNRCGWRHSKPGRIGRWEGVILRCIGARWKETLIAADSVIGREDDYVETGWWAAAAGRRRQPPTCKPQDRPKTRLRTLTRTEHGRDPDK